MIIDAFPFFNELDLLEIRLHELDPLVDHFVIVEALERYSGKPKAAVLRDNWSRVKGFESKIKYVVLPKLEPAFTNETSSWARENFTRNALWQPVLSLSTSSGDVVIISDCDEIPRMTAIRDAMQNGTLSKGIHRLGQRLYHYNVNQLCYGSDWSSHCWDKAVIGTVRQIQEVGGPHKARYVLRPGDSEAKTYSIPNAGWHFTYFNGSIDGIREKIQSCCEYSDDQEVAFLNKSKADALQAVVAGTTVRPKTRRSVWRETNDPVLPEYFLKNIERFRHFTDAYYRDLLKEHGK